MRVLFFFLKVVCLIGLGSAFTSMYLLYDGSSSWQTWKGYGEEVLAAMWLCAYALLWIAEISMDGRGR